MSFANPVPPTGPDHDRATAADLSDTLRRTSAPELMRSAFQRLRAADGFSHARSMAFLTALIFVQAVIALVGLASILGTGELSTTIVRTLHAVVPGATGLLLREAVHQAHETGAANWFPLVLGTLGATITGTTLLGQIERALNRLYGIERDRPSVRKYGRALVLTLTAGLLTVIAFAVMTFGREWSLDPSSTAATIWNLVRWPLAWVLLAAATAVIFRVSPRRRQPAVSWLLGGAIVGVALVVLATVGLDALFRLSTTFGDTYGPLAGLVALLFWAVTTAASILFGAALTAQLEAVRAGVPEPRRSGTSTRPDPAATAERAPVVVR